MNAGFNVGHYVFLWHHLGSQCKCLSFHNTEVSLVLTGSQTDWWLFWMIFSSSSDSSQYDSAQTYSSPSLWLILWMPHNNSSTSCSCSPSPSLDAGENCSHWISNSFLPILASILCISWTSYCSLLCGHIYGWPEQNWEFFLNIRTAVQFLSPYIYKGRPVMVVN